MQRLSLNIRKLKNCLGAEESQEECSVRESWSPTGAEAGAPQGLTPGLAERAGPVGPEEARCLWLRVLFSTGREHSRAPCARAPGWSRGGNGRQRVGPGALAFGGKVYK